MRNWPGVLGVPVQRPVCGLLFFFFPQDVEREFKEKVLFWPMSSAFCGFYGKSEQARMLPLSCRHAEVRWNKIISRGKNNFHWNRGGWADINSCQPQKYCRTVVLVLSGWECSCEWKRYFLNAEIAVFKVVCRLFQEYVAQQKGGCMLCRWASDRRLWCNTVA